MSVRQRVQRVDLGQLVFTGPFSGSQCRSDLTEEGVLDLGRRFGVGVQSEEGFESGAKVCCLCCVRSVICVCIERETVSTYIASILPTRESS